ncbi:MAG: hypothetical protein ACK5RY_05505 [Dolichospermum sp.]|jgi:hypothetical protein|nr:hypothetical protein [Anabaena sp. 49628_E55]
MRKMSLGSFSAVLLIIGCLNGWTEKAIAQTVIEEDKLNTNKGIYWAGSGFPFSQVAIIKDTLVDAPLGKVVIDRHGEGSSGFIGSPFSSPFPGRFVVVSFWGSKIEGCFVKMVIQSSPNDGQAELKQLVPKTIQLGLNNQILELSRNEATKVRSFKSNYIYKGFQNGKEINRSSTWYMTDTSFAIDGTAANFLKNAPKKEIRMRLVFENGDTRIVPIGKGTVENWSQTYGFNSACVPSK